MSVLRKLPALAGALLLLYGALLAADPDLQYLALFAAGLGLLVILMVYLPKFRRVVLVSFGALVALTIAGVLLVYFWRWCVVMGSFAFLAWFIRDLIRGAVADGVAEGTRRARDCRE